jgi:hypothetical protein
MREAEEGPDMHMQPLFQASADAFGVSVFGGVLA